jgi:hypothetical protein
MMKRETFAVADIYVPVKRRATLVHVFLGPRSLNLCKVRCNLIGSS